MVASVIVNILNKQLNREFDYLIPSYLDDVLKVGYRVKVNFSNRIVNAFVVKIKKESNYTTKLKTIIELIDSYQIVNEEGINLAYYIASNNYSYYALALDMMIPSALKIKAQKIAKVISKDNNPLKEYTRNGIIKVDALNDEALEKLYLGVKNNLFILDSVFKKNRNEKTQKRIFVNELYSGFLTVKEKALLDYLEEIGEILYDDFILESGFSKVMVNKLIEQKAINVNEEEILSNKIEASALDKKISLNETQLDAISKIKLNRPNTYLLHGVTGSGKTEIYMNLIEGVIKEGKEAIMLVPEISLTPQITSLFLARFKSDIAIIHSRLSVKDKYEEWKRIINKEVKIVVGARSAIFSPFDNLGIIIIDEEHEKSYVQDNNPKYDTLDIAEIRSKNHNCPLVLGSATPKIKDYYKALTGEYKLITLSKRVNNQSMPSSTIVDMREELKNGNKSVYSTILKEKLLKNYEAKHQSIIFLNRRGFASFVMCRSCGEVIKCPHCDVSLTFHDRTNNLVCHHCGYTEIFQNTCKSCGSNKIKFVGSGTEKLELEMKELIPEARVLRMDFDTTSRPNAYEEAYNKIKANEIDILIGTQMIAKGLDFDNVTLVGVVNADLALKYPEYDSNEVAFDLIEQVSGRAGRKSIPGEVIIQTYDPMNSTIIYAKNHDYEAFFNREIELRRLTSMPPFSTYIKIIVTSKDSRLALNEARNIVIALRKKVDNKSLILGPVQDFIFKKRDLYRYKIELQALSDEVLDELKYIYPLYQNNKEVDIAITRM